MRCLCPDDDFEAWDDSSFVPDLPALTVEVLDPDVVGTILGPDGEPLHTVLAPKAPFGFSR